MRIKRYDTREAPGSIPVTQQLTKSLQVGSEGTTPELRTGPMVSHVGDGLPVM